MALSSSTFLLPFVIFAIIQTAFAQEAVNYEAHIAQSITKIAAQDKLKAQIANGFDNYLATKKVLMLHACVHRLADYQGLQLNDAFLAQEIQAAQRFAQAKEALLGATFVVKTVTNNENIEEIIEGIKADGDLSSKTVTRGYCQSYTADFTDSIQKTLSQNVKDGSLVKMPQNTKANTLYLNKNHRVVGLTSKPNALSTLKYVVINNQSYPINCRSEDVSSIKQAIATQQPMTSAAYSAAKKFYDKYTTQINYVASCTVKGAKLPKTQSISDTYPWYQPNIIGTDDKKAAGDALLVLEQQSLILVLGHESCACNWSTQDNCRNINKLSKEFNRLTWGLISALEKEKSEHKQVAQDSIGEYIDFAKTEMNKDFCYIDRKQIVKQFGLLGNKMRALEPERLHQAERVARHSPDPFEKSSKTKLDTLLAAEKTLLLHSCIHRVADYDGIDLRPDFYNAEEKAISHYTETYNDFTHFTKLMAEMTDGGEGEVSQNAKKLLDTLKSPEQLGFKTITRGYCQVYGAGPEHGKEVTEALTKYAVDNAIAKKNEKLEGPAIYMSQKNQILNIVASSLGKQTPTQLYIGEQTLPIKCEYKDPEPYRENIARGKAPTNGINLAYDAAHYFYNHYSVQINYVLACQLSSPVFNEPAQTVSDTYPWYQPKVIGAENKAAAGDAFFMAKSDRFAIVLGHESCVCNWSDQQSCAEINENGRDYLKGKQELIDTVYEMKNKLYDKDDQSIITPINKIQQEIKHDFCFIDQGKIRQELERLRAGIEAIQPKQWWQFWK